MSDERFDHPHLTCPIEGCGRKVTALPPEDIHGDNLYRCPVGHLSTAPHVSYPRDRWWRREVHPHPVERAARDD